MRPEQLAPARAIVRAMVVCPRCGTASVPGQSVCVSCGAQLVAPPAGGLTSTLVAGSGNVSPTQPDAPATPQPQNVPPTWPDAPPLAPPAAPQPDAKRTMVGLAPAPVVSPPGPPAAVQPAFAPVGAVKRTMMGIAPASLPQPQPQAPAAGGHKQTMMGIAPPVMPAPGSAPQPAAPIQSQHKTKMGIAHPGIAPLHPQMPKSVPRPPAPAPAPASRGMELAPEDLAVLPGRRRSGSRIGWIVGLVLGLALLLLTAAVGIALWWRGSAPIEARAELDDAGRERLAITCPAPCELTRVHNGSSSAELRDGRATLPLERPLAIGENSLELELEQADGTRRTIEIAVPVAYRLKTDFSTLSEPTPTVSVLVEAEPETAVIVDGQAVTLDAEGKGKHRIDVSRDLTGSAAKVAPLERKVPYGVTRPGKDPERGELALRIGIVPLSVEAPGPSIVIEAPNFMLAGRTQTAGSVSVGGRPITVDPSGRFAQLMNVSSVGETTIVVRASAPDHAPRLFPIRVRRVASLATEAERFAARATRSYAAIASDIEGKRGWAVALNGEVVEARSEGHTSVILLDVESGCARRPCLARVVYGTKSSARSGDHLGVYGHVTRAVDGPRTGAKIPELSADFVREVGGGRR